MDIAFVADKGGVGKTTVSYHVATRLKQMGGDVGLLDLDRRSTGSKWVAMAEAAYFPAYPLDTLTGTLPDHVIRVWDTPAHPAVGMQESLMGACEVVVIVAQSDIDSQQAAAELCASLTGRGQAAVRILFNAIHPTSGVGAESIGTARRLGLPCLDAYVRRYTCYERSRWDGRAVCDGPYSSADNAWTDICAVTAEILKTVEETHATHAA